MISHTTTEAHSRWVGCIDCSYAIRSVLPPTPALLTSLECPILLVFQRSRRCPAPFTSTSPLDIPPSPSSHSVAPQSPLTGGLHFTSLPVAPHRRSEWSWLTTAPHPTAQRQRRTGKSQQCRRREGQQWGKKCRRGPNRRGMRPLPTVGQRRTREERGQRQLSEGCRESAVQCGVVWCGALWCGVLWCV